MNKYKTLVSNTALISLGTFGSKLLVFLMVRFYTGHLTTAQYGTADLITQTANLLLPIISVGITDGVFRFAIDSKIDTKSVFSSGVYTITLGGLAFLIIAPLLMLTHQFDGYVWLIVIYTMASCYHSLASKYIRARGSTAFFAIQGIVNTSLVIILNILFLAVCDFGVTGYVLSVAIADALSTLLIFFYSKLWRDITLKVEKTILKDILKYSIPMIPATIFWWVTSVSNRYLVNYFFGEEANGIYAVSYKLPTLLTLISTVFMQAWQFSAVTESENDRQEHINFFGAVWGSFQSVMFLVGSVVVALSIPLIKILTTQAFYDAWMYIPMLTAAMIFSAFANFMGSVYVVEKRSKNSFLTTMFGAVVNVVLNLVLIKSPLGVQGAAIATFASYLLIFVIRAINASKYIPFNLYWKNVILNTAIIVLQTVFMVCKLPFNIVVQVVSILLLALVNFKFIKVFLVKILSFVKGKLKK
ncbi:MAG: polysaccharide biosynthesis C-terminal domain-containing protein [Clostridia bacterium]|nr:polysaccharide biosynthesis C-terminal domain-containing protein [Clostridia bacterium]